jgi:riboflavin kinase/FMN adenylyltransferase
MSSVVTIGSYDGVHRGHQKILKEIREISKKNSLTSVVIYFPIPPRLYLSGNYTSNLITTPCEREKFIVVGKDFSLGKDREANSRWLKEMAQVNSITCKVLNFVKFKDHKISSSLIRKFLHHGLIKDANCCLGRQYFIEGTVVKGKQIGKKLGFPTANLKVDPTKILPSGVYAVVVEINGIQYFGVCNIGFRPTIEYGVKNKIAEVHILDFNMDIYGKKIIVKFVDKIRNEKKFAGLQLLKEQIKRDITTAKKIFKTKTYEICS